MEVYGVSVHGAPRDTEKMINRGTRSGGGYLGEADSRRRGVGGGRRIGTKKGRRPRPGLEVRQKGMDGWSEGGKDEWMK